MGQIAERLKFYDNGNNKRIKENFQGYLFNKINLSDSKHPISFYRSDFRGTKFKDCSFSKNDFSRSDMIDSVIENSSFSHCLFRYSELFNSFFSKTNIVDTEFKSASFSRLFFNGCLLEGGQLQDVTVRDCSFQECKIIKTSFVKNSFDEVKFEKCGFADVDLSSMMAINLYFTDCTFKDMIIDADYLGSYFFKGSYFKEVRIKYRGKFFNLEMSKQELIGNLFKIFLESNRYYEALNLFLQKNLLQDIYCSPIEITIHIIRQLLAESNFLRRSYQLEKIFHIYEFYFNTNVIAIGDYYQLFAFFDTLVISDLTLQEQITIANSLHRLKSLFDMVNYRIEFINSVNSDVALLEITVSDQNKDAFLQEFESFIKQLFKSASPQGQLYAFIGKRKGSVIYEIAINASVGIFLLRALKVSLKHLRSIGNEISQIVIDFSVTRKLLGEVKEAKSIDRLKQIKKFQKLSSKIIQQANKQNDIDANKLTSMIQSAKYFPNAFLKSDQ